MAPWKLPLIVALLIVPIVAAFLTGGPAVGVAVGAAAVLGLLVVAARQRPEGPIVSAPTEDRRRHILVVAACSLEEPAAVASIAEAARPGGGEDAEVLVLAPVRSGFLDRWASDVEPARQAAQRHLVATVAALAKVGIAAEARVGDENLVQAVEDQLQSFPASEVIVVSSEDGGQKTIDAAVAELGARLQAEFRHLLVAG